MGEHVHPDDPGKRDEHLAMLALVDDAQVTHRAVKTGNWSDPGVWDNGLPGDMAHVLIPVDVSVSVDDIIKPAHHTIRVDGILTIDKMVPTELRVGTLVIAPGGVLDLGREDFRVDPAVTCRILIADVDPFDLERDPRRLGTGILSHGTVRIHGAAKIPWTELAIDPLRGDTVLWPNSDLDGWRVGDRVLIPGTSPDANEDEVRVIKRILVRSVEVDALEFDHQTPEPWCRTHVANLTRNVIIESENRTLERRGHVMLMHSPDIHIGNAAFVGLGRTDKTRELTDPSFDEHGHLIPGTTDNPRGRYAVHFHRTGIATGVEPSRLFGCVAEESPGWGFVNHSSNVDMYGNVSFNVLGAGFVGEAGNEIGWMEQNLACRSQGSGDLFDKRQFTGPDDLSRDDFGHDGTGFFFQGPGIIIERNVACGHRHSGYTFWLRGLSEPGMVGNTSSTQSIPSYPAANLIDQPDVAALADEKGMVRSELVKLRRCRENTAYACSEAVDFSRGMFRPKDTNYNAIEFLKAWNIGDFVDRFGHTVMPDEAGAQGGRQGICVRYASQLMLVGCRLLGRGVGIGVNRNNPSADVIIQGCDIRGWEIGVRPIRRGHGVVIGTILRNTIDLEVMSAIHESELDLDLRENHYQGATALALRHDPLGNKRTTILLNGRQVFARETAPAGSIEVRGIDGLVEP